MRAVSKMHSYFVRSKTVSSLLLDRPLPEPHGTAKLPNESALEYRTFISENNYRMKLQVKNWRHVYT